MLATQLDPSGRANKRDLIDAFGTELRKSKAIVSQLEEKVYALESELDRLYDEHQHIHDGYKKRREDNNQIILNLRRKIAQRNLELESASVLDPIEADQYIQLLRQSTLESSNITLPPRVHEYSMQKEEPVTPHRLPPRASVKHPQPGALAETIPPSILQSKSKNPTAPASAPAPISRMFSKPEPKREPTPELESVPEPELELGTRLSAPLDTFFDPTPSETEHFIRGRDRVRGEYQRNQKDQIEEESEAPAEEEEFGTPTKDNGFGFLRRARSGRRRENGTTKTRDTSPANKDTSSTTEFNPSTNPATGSGIRGKFNLGSLFPKMDRK